MGQSVRDLPLSLAGGAEPDDLASRSATRAGFDYDSIDRDAAISSWQAAEYRTTAAQPDPAERQPALTGDGLEVTALTYEVTTRLGNHLAGRGLDIRSVNLVTTSTGCDL
jgi:hypothetical protein